jgi:hypothetical protein
MPFRVFHQEPVMLLCDGDHIVPGHDVRRDASCGDIYLIVPIHWHWVVQEEIFDVEGEKIGPRGRCDGVEEDLGSG